MKNITMDLRQKDTEKPLYKVYENFIDFAYRVSQNEKNKYIKENATYKMWEAVTIHGLSDEEDGGNWLISGIDIDENGCVEYWLSGGREELRNIKQIYLQSIFF